MKKLSLLAIAAAFILTSCGDKAKGDQVVTGEEQTVTEHTDATYNVDTATSTLVWKGYHKGGIDPRFGTLKAEGIVSVENGAVKSGTITIDMNTFATDAASVDVAKTGGKTAADLDAHLKNADFFEVEKYPSSKFEITNVQPFDASKDKSVMTDATHMISGNLTIKDKNVNVTFPAKVAVTDTEVNIQSKFTIQRQDWGLTYGTEGNPQDWMISADVDMDLNITAKK